MWRFKRLIRPCQGSGGYSHVVTMRFVKCQVSLGQIFLPSTSVLLCQYHATKALCSSLSTRCSYRRTKGQNQGPFQKARLFRNSRSILLKSTFIFFRGLIRVTHVSSQCWLIFILLLLLPERKRDENWKLWNEKLFFQMQISNGKKYTFRQS